MLAGQISGCDPAVCDIDIPVPAINYTKITAEVRARTSFNPGELLYLTARLEGIGYGCVSASETYSSDFFSVTSGLRLNMWVTDSLTTTTCEWTSPTSSVLTVTGSYKRASDGKLLATSVPGKYRQYVFTNSLASGDYVQPIETTIGGPDLIPAFGCCSPLTPSDDVANITAGPTVSKTISLVAPTIRLNYLAVATSQVAGIQLSLKVAGVAAGPWTVQVQGSTVSFTNGAGTVTTYSGTLTSVAASINAAAAFTATIPVNVTKTAGITHAFVSDIKPYISDPINVAGCTTDLVLVDFKDHLAPSSTLAGINVFSFGGNAYGFYFTDGGAFPDTKAGLDAFLAQEWKPKSAAFSNSSGNYYYIEGDFDNYSTFPYLNYYNTLSGTVVPADYWSTAPGSSVQTETVTISRLTGSSETITAIPYCSTTIPGGGFENCVPPVGPEYCNTSFLACVDCSGTPLVTCDFPHTNCCCEHSDSTVLTYPTRDEIATQTLTGKFRLS